MAAFAPGFTWSAMRMQPAYAPSTATWTVVPAVSPSGTGMLPIHQAQVARRHSPALNPGQDAVAADLLDVGDRGLVQGSEQTAGSSQAVRRLRLMGWLE